MHLKYIYIILTCLIIGGNYSTISATEKIYGAQYCIIPMELLNGSKDIRKLSSWLELFTKENEGKLNAKKISTCEIDIPLLEPITHLPTHEERKLAERLEGFARQFIKGSHFYSQKADIAILMLHKASEYGESTACEKMAEIFEKGLYGVNPDPIKAKKYWLENRACRLWRDALGQEAFEKQLAYERAAEAKKLQEEKARLEEQERQEALLAASAPVLSADDVQLGWKETDRLLPAGTKQPAARGFELKQRHKPAPTAPSSPSGRDRTRSIEAQ